MTAEEIQALGETGTQNLKLLGERFFSFMMWNSHWRKPGDHNHLRISRILRVLKAAGHHDTAHKIHALGLSMGKATAETKGFWEKAMRGQ